MTSLSLQKNILLPCAILISLVSFTLISQASPKSKRDDNSQQTPSTGPLFKVSERKKLLKRLELTTLTATALTGATFLLKAFFTILDLTSLAKSDFYYSDRRKQGLYTGRLSNNSTSQPPGTPDNESLPLISSIEYRKSHKDSYFEEINQLQESTLKEKRHIFKFNDGKYQCVCVVPDVLRLKEEPNVRLVMTDNALNKIIQGLPIKQVKLTDPNGAKVAKQKKKLNSLLKGGLGSALSLLGFSSRVNFEYCRRGLNLDSYVFCYGRTVGSLTKEGKILNVEFLTPSVDIMKKYLKEKIFRNVVVAVTAGVLIGISVSLLSLNIRKGVVFWLRKEVKEEQGEPQEEKDPAAATDFISKHYPFFGKKQAINAVRCKCEKFVKNVVNFPCTHVDCCLSCYVERTTKQCGFCMADVFDYFVIPPT